eukprot:11655426-Ditylum_brightwellii.AAC.1
MDELPTNEDIKKSISQLNNSTAVCKIIHNFWEEEQQRTKFDIGKLGILPPKGDISQPGNYRGIMMLEVGQKNISNIILMRLKPWLKNLIMKHNVVFIPKEAFDRVPHKVF